MPRITVKIDPKDWDDLRKTASDADRDLANDEIVRKIKAREKRQK